MNELKDVEISEYAPNVIERKQRISYVMMVVISVVIVFSLIFGLFYAQNVLSSVDIHFSKRNTSLILLNNGPNTDSVEFELYFSEKIPKPLHYKLEIIGTHNEKLKITNIPVSIQHLVGTTGNTHQVSTLSTTFQFNIDANKTKPITMYSTVIPSNNSTFSYVFKTKGFQFSRYYSNLYYLDSDITPLVYLRNNMLNITFISFMILIIQYYLCRKSFTSSMALIIGIFAVIAFNPSVIKQASNDFINIYRQISYSLFLAIYYAAVPTIALSYCPFSNLLPTLCFSFFVLFSFLLFISVFPLFTPRHQPFYIIDGFNEYPDSEALIFALPLIGFLSIFGIILLVIATFFVKGSDLVKILLAIAIQLYSTCTTLWTTFRPLSFPEIIKLHQHVGLFYDGIVHVICSLVFALIFTNFDTEIDME